MLSDEGGAHICLHILVDAETLQVHLLGLPFHIDDGEDVIGIELADFHHVVVEMRREVIAGHLELAVAEELQDPVIALKGADVLSPLVGIESPYRIIVP